MTTKYGIKHKTSGKYFTARIGGIFYFQDYPKTNPNEYWDSMTECLLIIISIHGESFLEVFQKEF